MADSQLVLRAQQFSQNVVPLAQQMYSKTYNSVMIKSDVNSKRFSQDQIGTWEMEAKGSLNSSTPENDPNFERRWANVSTYHDARLLDRSVNLQILSNPKSEMTQNAARAIGRQIDDVNIAASTGTALSDETGTTSNTLPSGQIIVNGGTGLTVAKFQDAAAILDGNDVDDADRHCWISPIGLHQLLADEKATSSDYMNVKALIKGDIDTFYGFNVIKSTRLSKTGDIRDCVFFQKSGIMCGMPEIMYIRTDERSDKSYSYQVYYELNIGCVRLEEEKVVKVQIDETK
jgi:hypothetical protein